MGVVCTHVCSSCNASTCILTCTCTCITKFKVFFKFVAAVTSLAKFGASCEDLLESILVLLER